MKYIFFVFGIMVFWSCSNGSSSTAAPDSMNAIEQHPLEDTEVAPFPNGYAPPDAKMDTSKYRKDSLRARDSMNAAKH